MERDRDIQTETFFFISRERDGYKERGELRDRQKGIDGEEGKHFITWCGWLQQHLAITFVN